MLPVQKTILATELMINLKRIALAFISTIFLFIILFFINRPDYYTEEDIINHKNAEQIYYAQKEPTGSQYFYASKKSKYFGQMSSGTSEEMRNQIAQENFLRDIGNKSTLFFLFLSSFLIIGRYALLGFNWISKTSNS